MTHPTLYIGIDCGGTFIKGIITDTSGKQYGFSRVRTGSTPDEIDESIWSLVRDLSLSAGIKPDELGGIGIGSAGPIDREQGMILKAPNIPALNSHPIASRLAARARVRVVLENDATAALVGTKWIECGERYRDWIMITLGTGIGGGAVIDGKVYLGRDGNAMEVGHMSIDMNGRPCPCGSRGCWERYASGTAMTAMAREAGARHPDSTLGSMEDGAITPQRVCELAENGDEIAAALIEEYSTYLGIGLANLANILAPEAIYIGGGLSLSWRLFSSRVSTLIEERVLPGIKEKLTITAVGNPNTIACFGAAKIVMDIVMDIG